MRSIGFGLLCVAFLGLGIRPHELRADGESVVVGPLTAGPEIVVAGPPMEEQASTIPGIVLLPDSQSTAEPWTRPARPSRRPRERKWCCWADHNHVGCGSLKAECTFLFGSCRAFFGEPCLNGPPSYPTPYGDRYDAGRSGCNCR